MRELRLVGVHEDGTSLLLADDEGTRYSLALDDDLRAALRHSLLSSGRAPAQSAEVVSPREVQALIRAGLTSDEVAERSGWTVEKVHRYEVPILAEREYVTRLARLVRLRRRGSAAEPTLATRVAERLQTRGVDERSLRWDAFRQVGPEWTVIATFAAGGRQRRATWAFDPVTRRLHAQDDEARWLSEDDASAAGPLGREVPVYDVEADGGVHESASAARSTLDALPAAPAEPAAPPVPPSPAAPSAPVDLVTAMRQRTSARLRGGARRRDEALAAPPRPPADHDVLLPVDAAVAALPDEPAPPDVPGAALPSEPAPVGALPAEPAPVAALPAEPAGPMPDAESFDDAAAQPSEQQQPGLAAQAGGSGDVSPEAAAPLESTNQPPRGVRSRRKASRTPVPAWKDVISGTNPAPD